MIPRKNTFKTIEWNKQITNTMYNMTPSFVLKKYVCILEVKYDIWSAKIIGMSPLG